MVEQRAEELTAAPAKVDVTPQADDEAIAERLQRVLVATDVVFGATRPGG